MVRVDGAVELLDRPVGATARAAALADIDRLSAWFGGHALTLREIRRVAGAAATALPFRAAAADVVMASLVFHHLEPDDVVAALRAMAAAARGAVVINDLLRTRLALALVWVTTRLLLCHPIARHDGPLSVRRGYSGAELCAVAEKAGIPALAISEYPVFGRLVAVTR